MSSQMPRPRVQLTPGCPLPGATSRRPVRMLQGLRARPPGSTRPTSRGQKDSPPKQPCAQHIVADDGARSLPPAARGSHCACPRHLVPLQRHKRPSDTRCCPLPTCQHVTSQNLDTLWPRRPCCVFYYFQKSLCRGPTHMARCHQTLRLRTFLASPSSGSAVIGPQSLSSLGGWGASATHLETYVPFIPKMLVPFPGDGKGGAGQTWGLQSMVP